MPIDGYIDTIFATGGDLTPVPDGIQSSGAVSYEQGFGILYSTPAGSGGFEFPRAQHNQILNDVTTAVQQYQQHGTPDFITSVMNGGTAYSYSKYDRVRQGGVVYLSLADTNTDTPPSAKWLIVSSRASMMTFSSGTATVATSTTVFLGMNQAVSSAAATVNFIIPYNYRISDLYGYTGSTPTMGTRTYTVIVNSAATALTAAATGTNSTASDLVNSVTGSAGDQISVKLVTSGTDVDNHKVSLMIEQV